jgi:hypothetical protein
MYNINNKQLILVIFLIGFPLILTNGSFFALAELDPTRAYIRWAGECGYDILKYSGYIFGMYGFANYMYNINYCFPKTLDLIFLVKWFDKANSWLKFSDKSELEKHLEKAEKTYSHLYIDAKREIFSMYKDIKTEIYQNILQPCYNNTFGAFLAYSGFKPVEREITKEIEKEVMKEVIRKVPEFTAALPKETVDAINILKENMQKYTAALERATKFVELEINEKHKLVRLDFLVPYMQKEYYADKVRRFPNSSTPYRLVSEMGPGKINEFVIEQIVLETNTSEIAPYPDKPNTEYFFKVIGRLKVDIEAELNAKRLKLKRLQKNYDPGFCYFDIAIDDQLITNPDCICFMEFLKTHPELENTGIEIHKDAAGNIYTVTMNSYTNGHATAVIDTFEEIQKSAVEIGEYTNALTMSYSSVALAAATVVLPWQEIIHNLTHMNELVSAIQNPEAARVIVSSLQQVGQIVPDFLQPFVTTPVIPTAQELSPADIVEVKQNVPSAIVPSTFGINWTTGLGLLVAAGAIGGTVYCVKNGINPASWFTAADTKSAAAGTDFSKYLNLK